MSIRVKEFKWDKGKNDLEYIKLLEKNLDSSLSTYRECAKTAREQYKKGYQQGRSDERKEIIEILAQLVICEVIDVNTYEMIRNQIGAKND